MSTRQKPSPIETEVLRRMLKTPPTPHVTKAKPKPKPRKKAK
jgi:hypothetical protein